MLSSRLKAFVIPTSQTTRDRDREHVVGDDLDLEPGREHDRRRPRPGRRAWRGGRSVQRSSTSPARKRISAAGEDPDELALPLDRAGGEAAPTPARRPATIPIAADERRRLGRQRSPVGEATTCRAKRERSVGQIDGDGHRKGGERRDGAHAGNGNDALLIPCEPSHPWPAAAHAGRSAAPPPPDAAGGTVRARPPPSRTGCTAFAAGADAPHRQRRPRNAKSTRWSVH